MEEEFLGSEETQFHANLCQKFMDAENNYEKAKKKFQQAEEEYSTVLGARTIWYDYLVEKYNLQSGDRILESGKIVRSAETPPS